MRTREFTQKIKQGIEIAKQSDLFKRVKERPITLLPIIVLAVILFFFWQAIVVLALVAVTILVVLKFLYTGPKLQELMQRKRALMHEIEILQAEYMKRRMREEDFLQAFRKKQTTLIELEALIDEKFNKEKLPMEDSSIKELTAKKRHIVEELLGRKRLMLREMGIAEKMYLRRKIDAETYQGLINQKRQRLIELEAQLRQIYGEESISQIMGQLKDRLASVEKQMQDESKKKQEDIKKTEKEIAEEIASQVKYFRGR